MTEPRIVGADWSRKYASKFRDYDPPTPRPCPLCGAPKGECAPNTGADHGTETTPHP